MAVVNKIKLEPAVQNCLQLAEAFLRIVLCEAGDAFEIRVMFDKYLEFSLKESTREKRGPRLEVTEYEISHNTSLKKVFVSHKHKTKVDNISRSILIECTNY